MYDSILKPLTLATLSFMKTRLRKDLGEFRAARGTAVKLAVILKDSNEFISQDLKSFGKLILFEFNYKKYIK